MKDAARELDESDGQVAQVAYHFGYQPENVSQFTRDFRRVFGMCPTAFRALAERCVTGRRTVVAMGMRTTKW